MNYVPKIDRRSFVDRQRRARRRARHSAFRSASSTAGAQAATPRARRLGRGQARRHRRGPHRALGDGAGHHHRPRPARRRGAREPTGRRSPTNIRRPARASRANALGRRFRPAAAAASASRTNTCARRRGGAPDAAPGRGQPVEGSGRAVHRRQRRHHPRGLEPQHHVRQGRRRGREAAGAGEARAQGSKRLEDRRQAAQAAPHRRKGDRPAGLWGRPQATRHAQCHDQGMPGVRRQGEELRRRQGRRHEGREEGPAGR